jgi:hypothetical protein
VVAALIPQQSKLIVIGKETLQKFIEDKLSTYQVAAKLGCSPSNIRYLIHKYGLHPSFGPHGKGRRTRLPEEHAARVVEYVVAHRRRLKDRAIEYKGGRCQLCSYAKCNGALEFHHVNKATKRFGLAKNGRIRSWTLIRAELDKCILICSNCHREVEAGIRLVPRELTAQLVI